MLSFAILAVGVGKIGDVCCLPTPVHQPFSSNSLDLSAPEEAYSRNVSASGTLKFGYEDVFKIATSSKSSRVWETEQNNRNVAELQLQWYWSYTGFKVIKITHPRAIANKIWFISYSVQRWLDHSFSLRVTAVEPRFRCFFFLLQNKYILNETFFYYNHF